MAILARWNDKWVLTRKGSLTSKLFGTSKEAVAFAKSQGWRVIFRVK